ncbi:MAG: hypothetical protein MK411_10360, partial [SAR202 cluster bacterium]|nr:hypothetical protein [SAR202 cluster bacterium]
MMAEMLAPLKTNLILVIGGSLLVLLGVGFLIFSSVCPCAVLPGGYLFGERVDAPVTDWNLTTANQEN